MANAIYESSRGYDVIPLEDTFLRDRKIFLCGEVDAAHMDQLVKQVMYLDSVSKTEEITLYINSHGGSVQDGLALYDTLRLVQAPIRTVSTGIAASMGAVLFLAGDKREMLPHSKLMIHDPSFSSMNLGGKKSAEVQLLLDNLNACRQLTASIIAERTGKTLEEVYQVTAEDTYYTAKEAVEWGLATSIIESEKEKKQ